jgi:hypothetical protein
MDTKDMFGLASSGLAKLKILDYLEVIKSSVFYWPSLMDLICRPSKYNGITSYRL